ncbi:MAG TPA: 16S rRNA (adenine(1518)-N(6)/adenine(1519)-N(6))-dimethyltransferase RsmA [Candidatus Babeliales bacterium]|nr:16S rRNA (adenine(1518)-N(6)/adenine(1519)-N(6))-dimethyltransferase RsmA [Candidatus Babeliales bacterium]
MVYQQNGITVKKRYGQHFLRDQQVIDSIISNGGLTSSSSVFEIGCGDGVLTRAILATDVSRLWVFEIDEQWGDYVRNDLPDTRLTMHIQNILDVDPAIFKEYAPWTLLANLPYQITFPILHLLYNMRSFVKEGVIMVQEEVAQKILKTSGKGYGQPSLFFQRYFEWKKLDKVSPKAFYPAPKVDSRLLYFKPRAVVVPIEQEDEFWKFVKICFKQPRRTLKNNLSQTHYAWESISTETLALRSQQLSMDDFMQLWQQLKS